MRDFLINDVNVKLMSVNKNTNYNVKRLLNNDKLTQDQCIKFGKIFEDFIKKLIRHKGYKLINEELIDICAKGSETNKGKKNLDICFSKHDCIYYFESKLNLNLDSEKSKATDNKITQITDFLITENKGIRVYSGLITGWWEREKGMKITPKTNLLFMKDFLELLDIQYTKDEYYSMMSDFGKSI
jgi:hypothetical protein